MACDHRYIVRNIDGKGEIICRRCGDVRADGLPLDPRQQEAEERIAWERKRRDSPVWLPPDIA